MMNTFRGRLGLLGIAGAMVFCAPASATPITYHIHVDTSSISGITGNLEFSLLPGLTGPVDLAIATFFNFTTDGGPYATVPPDFGDVTGSLPGPLTLDNAGPGADHAESFTYGTFFDVFVTLDVPVISPGAGSGSTLGLNVEDSSFASLLSSDYLLLFATDTQGNQTIINNNQALADAEATPEPATLLLLGSGLLLAGLRRSRSTSAR